MASLLAGASTRGRGAGFAGDAEAGDSKRATVAALATGLTGADHRGRGARQGAASGPAVGARTPRRGPPGPGGDPRWGDRGFPVTMSHTRKYRAYSEEPASMLAVLTPTAI